MVSSEKMASWFYWVNDAHNKPEAVALASRLNLDFPRGEMQDFKSGLMYPVRRLVVTGEDTPENFALLFGPRWETSIPELHKQARLEVLLCPPPTSPAHTVGSFMDEGCPVWKPIEPSEEEEKAIASIRRLQGITE